MREVISELETREPDALARFDEELSAAGFAPMDPGGRRWQGPLAEALEPYTDVRQMTIVLREGWPYQPPRIEVAGLAGWHADHEHACLWQEGDLSLVWITFGGILDRIGQWVTARELNLAAEGAALDAWAYFERASGETVSIELSELTAPSPPQPGQAGDFSLVKVAPLFFRAVQGSPGNAARHGRWFAVAPPAEPPRNLDEIASLLTDAHRGRLARELAKLRQGQSAWSVVGLVWTSAAGTDVLLIAIDRDPDGGVSTHAMRPTPHGIEARGRRAGSDFETLRGRRVVLFGVGSIGSHLANILTNSGLGFIRLVDAELLLPVNLVRHAAPYQLVGHHKAMAMQVCLKERCLWLEAEAVLESPWSPGRLRDLIADVDLVVDATGNGAFARQLSSISGDAGRAFISAALYRGGRVVRVRRQLVGDFPIRDRGNHWRYPEIPRGTEQDDVGFEVGCTAPVSNAPPNAVIHAAALAADVVTHVLMERPEAPDELIEVLRPLEESPFDKPGRLWRPDVAPVAYITSEASSQIRRAASNAYPNETGGILVGVTTGVGEPWVVQAIELPSERPSPGGYQVPADSTQAVIASLRRDDDRLGYLGEWHSHPNASGRSATDIQTMRMLAKQRELVGAPLLVVAQRMSDDYELAASRMTESHEVLVALRASGPLPGNTGSSRRPTSS